MITNKTIDTFLNDAEEQLKTIFKEQENYDDMIEFILLPSIREQVETILTKQTGVELTETSSSFLGEKKMLNKVCKDLDNVEWEQLGEGMGGQIDELRRKLREKLEEEYVEKLLKNEGITNMESLLNYGPTKYTKVFGFSFIGKTLGRSMKRVTVKDLEGLGEKLGYKKKTIKELQESHRKILDEEGIIDMEGLVKFGPKKYTKKFGKFFIGKILGVSLEYVSKKNLQELGKKLEYKEKTLKELLEFHRKQLEEKGIIDMESLLNFGVEKYGKIFGYSLIGKILGRILKKVKKKNLEDLGEKLGYKEKTIKELLEFHGKQLEEKGITDMESLLKLGVVKYEKIFAVSFIGKILGRTIKAVSIQSLQDLGKQLGFTERTVEELLESHRQELEEVGIVDLESLLQFGSTKYHQKFGFTRIGRILGRIVAPLTLKDIQELGEKLWPEVLIEETNES